MHIRVVFCLLFALLFGSAAPAAAEGLEPVEGVVESVDPFEGIIQIDERTFAVSPSTPGVREVAEGQAVRATLQQRRDGIWVTQLTLLKPN